MREVQIHQIDQTPIGKIWIASCDYGLIAIQIGGVFDQILPKLAIKLRGPATHSPKKGDIFILQIQEYLQGRRKNFNLPIHWGILSSFQQKALKAVYTIPYGETRTYSQIAAEIGIPHAPRAVGRANATNPMPLVIPCHRVIGTDGSLRGYGGGDGIQTKRWLLDLERKKPGRF